MAPSQCGLIPPDVTINGITVTSNGLSTGGPTVPAEKNQLQIAATLKSAVSSGSMLEILYAYVLPAGNDTRDVQAHGPKSTAVLAWANAGSTDGHTVTVNIPTGSTVQPRKDYTLYLDFKNAAAAVNGCAAGLDTFDLSMDVGIHLQ